MQKKYVEINCGTLLFGTSCESQKLYLLQLLKENSLENWMAWEMDNR